MGLWIRSQDKRILAKIETIHVDYRKQNVIIANYKQLNRDDEDYLPLGKYDTSERALEVLDEITTEVNKYLGTPVEIVYEMPQE